MSGSIGSHIVREDDGAATGVWGPFVLKSAFQPIFAFEAGKLSVTAFEGLLRPFREGEFWTPLEFFNSIPAAERFPVETLSRTLHLTNAAACLPQDASIFINFDPSVFTAHALVDAAINDMRLVLSETGIGPDRVVCEVTEKETTSQAALFALVASLRESGFRIAVDDYGADDSDMGRVRELHPDIIKFDAKWIRRLMDTGPGYALLTTMVSTFAEQGILTVFEGIEEPWQLELAEKSGAAMVQGFVLARPELAPTSFFEISEPAPREHHRQHAPGLGGPTVPRAAGKSGQSKSFGRRSQPQ